MSLTQKFLAASITIKSVDEERRELVGIATSPHVDRVDDVVEPTGARFASQIPLLIGHDHLQPVGTAMLQRATPRGLPFTARIARVTEPGLLKDRCDLAWQSVKHGLIKAVSIGFRSIGRPQYLEGGGQHFTDFEILELSLVTVPAQPQATIDGFKSHGSTRMHRAALVEITRTLELTIVRCEGGPEIRIAFSKLGAQTAARALLEFAGVDAPQVTRGAGGSVELGVRDLTLTPNKAATASKAKLATGRRGVVKLSDPGIGGTQSRVTRRVKV